jgi:putative MFS transporter
MTETGLLARMDSAPLKARYWRTFSLIVLLLVCEIFDFFIVGFLVSALAPQWGLTFGQSTLMLLSAGVGAMIGAVSFGWLADKIGRKRVLLTSATLCCVCAGSLAFLPDGSWIGFTLLRFLVGVGYGGAGASQFALIAEYTPARRRTLITGSLGVPAGVGLLLASFVVSNLFGTLGWRGTAMLGYAPILLLVAIAFVAPESARWRLARGQSALALREADSMLDLSRAPEADASLAQPPIRSNIETYSAARRLWLIILIQLGLGATLSGVTLWGPTILAQLFEVSPQHAAGYFVWVSLAGLLGRIAFTLVPHKIGRVPSGQIVGYAGAAALALAAAFNNSWLYGAPLFFVFLLIGQFFYDGGFSNLMTYAAELHPVSMGARAMGVQAAAGGAGKLIGPLVLGALAGAGNLVTPHATAEAVAPAFFFFAGACLVVGLSYSLLGVETHRRALAVG